MGCSEQRDRSTGVGRRGWRRGRDRRSSPAGGGGRRLGAPLAVPLLLAVAAIFLSPSGRAAGAPGTIAGENARGGTRSWDVRDAPLGEIEGYTSQVSYLPGEMLEVH